MALTEKEFLGAIARKMGRSPQAAPPPRPGHVRGMTPPPVNMSGREAMADWFTRELTKLTGTVDLVNSLGAAGQAVADVVSTRCAPGGDVILWDDTVALAAKTTLEAAGFKTHVWPVERARCAGAVAGVTSARFAVAETGSIALAAAPGLGRSVSLLPPLHLAIVPTSRLLATVGDYFRALGTIDRMPAALNLITGPSRTADIELELCVGVHGPAALHVVLYHD